MLVMSSRTHSGSGKLAPRLFPLQSLPEGTFIGSFPIEANCRSRGQCVGNILQNNYKKVRLYDQEMLPSFDSSVIRMKIGNQQF